MINQAAHFPIKIIYASSSTPSSLGCSGEALKLASLLVRGDERILGSRRRR